MPTPFIHSSETGIEKLKYERMLILAPDITRRYVK